MKNKQAIILFAFLFFAAKSFSQNRVRTLNDKPGTPSSLRTPYNGPTEKVHTIHRKTVPNQSIYHGATESNKVIEKKQPATVVVPNTTDVLVPQPPVTVSSQPVIIIGTVPNTKPPAPAPAANGQNNVSNPIRK